MKAVVEAENISKSFGEKQVLQGTSLTVGEGENVVILGRSGTGKSVFIKCIVGLVEPDEGTIKVLGKDVLNINRRDMNAIRKDIGFLFQGAALYDSMSVRENLAFPLRTIKMNKDEVETHVKEALDNVGLAEAIDKMPAELSGGMRKRVGLARAIIMKPKIILYDEPTTGLDVITSREISELILDIQKKYNTGSIIITHDMPCAKITANRILVLRDGKFAAEGTYDELEKHENPDIKSFFEF